MLDKVVFFLHVVRTGSISEAAKHNNISPSAASRWLNELEEKMGVSLLKRTTRKITPTQAGQRLFDRFSLLHTQIDDVFNEVQNMSSEDRGTIKIASTPLFAKHYLSQIIGEYLQLHPSINFVVLETAFEVDHVHDVDFAIRANATYRGFQDKDSLLVKRSLLREPLMACCSPDYIEKNGKPVVPDDLKHHRCLYASTLVGGNRWIFELDGEYSTVEIPQTVEADDSEILKNIAINGGGIAYLPISLISQELSRQTLQPVLENYVSSQFELNLYFKPRKYMPARCANFKDYLIERVPEIKRLKQQGSSHGRHANKPSDMAKIIQ
ncbi:LysR family transcriptional regulator [Photobacterium gaetbulicola]|uniref:Putative transcription regulator n=1 Tax=Photobacterium gaetbulicola Gung47 TaxID=658445 RepID=A0A0C5WMP3_9GAMM|nr:LysR family transcriptional regulator [Photobacterium gaetbulicola]AJR06319.1 putative transcription regulator [Photobacterium gaetbulicola Gung47]PSU08741.1 LysR family transcriptional regulator [Photobacterium gaetbulicola]